MLHRKAIAAFLGLVLVAAIAACGGSQEKSGTEGTDSAELSGVDNRTVITVNGTEIKAYQVGQELDRLLQQYGSFATPAQIDSMRPELEKNARDNVINKILLTDAAAARGLEIEPDELDQVISRFKDQLPDEQAYQNQLSELGMTEETFRDEWRQNLLIQKLLGVIVSDAAGLTDESVSAQYEENTEDYWQGETVQASHILLQVPADATEEVRASKREEIEGIRQQVLAGGDFAELAREHSDCPSAPRGGDLGEFPRGRMVGAFEEAAFSLGEGEVSDVVETQFGYHVIKVTKHVEGHQMTFDEARPMIEQKLIEEKLDMNARREVLDNFLEEIRNEADIVESA